MKNKTMALTLIFSALFARGAHASLNDGSVGAEVGARLPESEKLDDPFDRGLAMDSHLQRAVLEALSIRWGLKQ